MVICSIYKMIFYFNLGDREISHSLSQILRYEGENQCFSASNNKQITINLN